MKTIATIAALVSLSQVAFAGDLATPTPTPTPYLGAVPRRGYARRMAEREHNRAREADSQSRTAARAQARASRRSTATAQAQARDAARERERAQHEVEAEARQEEAKASARPTSDLMRRMGFSEQAIEAQKSLEEPAKPVASPSASPASDH